MMTEQFWESHRAEGQAKLDAAGLQHVKLVIGHFRHGDQFRFEARLQGGSPTDRLKAGRLLPFTDSYLEELEAAAAGE